MCRIQKIVCLWIPIILIVPPEELRNQINTQKFEEVEKSFVKEMNLKLSLV